LAGTSKLAEESIRRVLNTPLDEPPIEISPAADAAMRKLVELFSDPAMVARAHFRCFEGATEFDVLFESIIDDQFGYEPNSEYKNWVSSA
jgi:hypothetical protein